MDPKTDIFDRISAYLDNHPIFVRSFYCTVLALCVAFISIHMYRFASIVTDENIYVDDERGVRIIHIDAGGASENAGLKEGDIIVEIDGKPVKNAKEAMIHILNATKGDKLQYTVLRDGERVTKTIVLALLGLPLIVLNLLITGGLFILMGAFLILRRPNRAGARLFGWATLATGIFLIVMFNYPVYFYRDFLIFIGIILSLLGWSLGFSAMYHLFLRFPVQRFLSRIPRWFFIIVYASPIIIAALLYFRILPARMFPIIISTALLAVIFELILRWKLRLIYNQEYRATSRYIKIAGLIAIACSIGLTFVKAFSGWQAIFLLMFLIPALIWYTITRFRIYDIYIVFRRTSLYLAAVTLLNLATIAVFILLIFFLSNRSLDIPAIRISSTSIELIKLESFPPEDQDVIEKRILFVAIIFLAALLWQTRKMGKRYINTRFHRGSYDYKHALENFTRLSIQYSEPRALGEAVVTELTTLMHLKGAVFARRRGEQFEICASHGIHVPGYVEARFSNSAQWIKDLKEKGTSQAVDNLHVRELFRETGIEFITPVILDSQIETLIFLGEKLSETNFTKEDVELLDNLAINVGEALMTMNFYEDAKEQERLRRELEIARKIQLGSLPTEIPSFPGIDVAAVSIPANEVGGDFYDFLGRHDAITFLVGDVSGKGTSAALYLSRVQGIIRAIHSYNPTLWELFVRLNTQIFELIDRQAYLTLSALRIDLMDCRATFLRAGHLPLLHYKKTSDEVVVHQPKGIGIGLDNNMFGEYLEEQQIQPGKGDIFLMPSDGVTEAFSKDLEEFSLDRLTGILRSYASQPASAIKNTIITAITDFTTGAIQNDDITFVILKFE